MLKMFIKWASKLNSQSKLEATPINYKRKKCLAVSFVYVRSQIARRCFCEEFYLIDSFMLIDICYQYFSNTQYSDLQPDVFIQSNVCFLASAVETLIGRYVIFCCRLC